jgi:aldose 1-epimerase
MTKFIRLLCMIVPAIILSYGANAQLLQQNQQGGEQGMSVRSKMFGKTPDGKPVQQFTLSNKNGMTVKIINYGATVTDVLVSDSTGKTTDVVLGFDDLDGYLHNTSYFGCIVGRYANRIAKGKFTLDKKTYSLATNDNGNHLHGGTVGFDKVIWQATPIRMTDGTALLLKYTSKDSEEGYPGTLTALVTYTLTNNNELKIAYEATTDKSTPVNLTHHSYFNLAGAGNGDILQHQMMINADKFTVVDKHLIPTGVLQNVIGTSLDFTSPHTIGERIANVEGGYDHNFVLRKTSNSLSLAARVYEPTSGRMMEVYTTEPGLQFYSGNFLDGNTIGKGSTAYKKHFGFCLEAQHYPDSPNHPKFPSVILKPGDTYRQTTIYKFSVK